MSTKKRIRRDLTFQQKKDILDELQRCGNVTHTAKKFNLERRHVQQMKKMESEIRDACNSSSTSSSRKRFRGSAGGSRSEMTPKHKKAAKTDTTNGHRKDAECEAEAPEHNVQAISQADSGNAGKCMEPRDDNLSYYQHASSSISSNQPSAVGQKTYESDQGQSSISTNHQSPVAVDSEAADAAQILLDLITIASPEGHGVVSHHDEQTEQAASSSTEDIQSVDNSTEMQTSLPITVDYLNSPPDNEGQIEIESHPCHTCSVQNRVQSAERFCIDCKQHFCHQHVELHSSLFGEIHSIVNSVSDGNSALRLAASVCPEHAQKTIVSGCELCSHMFCVDCLCWLNSKDEEQEAIYPCSRGRGHEPFPIEQLEQRLKRKAVSNLENKLQEGQQTLAAAQTKLGEAISRLHAHRDNEREELKEKLRKLEEKFRKLEDETRASFSREVKLADLDKLVTSLETKLKHLNAIDSNTTHNPAAVLAEYRQLISDDHMWTTPSLRLSQYEWRDIKSEEGPDSGLTGFDWIEIKPPPSLGTRLTDIKLDINESEYTHRLCHNRDMTYISYRLSDRVVSVDESGTVSNIITLDKDSGYSIWDIAVNNDKIFVLTYDYIRVYSLTGGLITTWKLSESCDSMTVSGDLLVLSMLYDDLFIYTEEGQMIRELDTGLNILDFYPVDSKSVIVRYDDGPVCRVDIRTGGIMWRRGDIEAWSAVYDGHGNLLILTAAYGLKILNVSTGETLKYVSNEDICTSLGYKVEDVYASELGISGETLIILCEGSFKQISNSSSDNSDDESDEESDDESDFQKETHLFKLQLDYPDRP